MDATPFTRRTFLQGTLAAAATAAFGADAPTSHPADSRIDRKSVVSRHNVIRTASKASSPLQVGNGNFAFGADVTGLQTFVAHNTMSQWGWHYQPLPAGQTVADMQDEIWPSRSRGVPYDSGDKAHPQITEWVFANPSRINLGRIGLSLTKADGTAATEKDLTDVHQELDLWTGTLRSRFKLDGKPVEVTTASHPDRDAVAVKVVSPLIPTGRVATYLDFPAPDDRQFGDHIGTWNHSDKYPTAVDSQSSDRIDLTRQLGDDRYHVAVRWQPGVTIHRPDEAGRHRPAVAIVKARYGADIGWLDVTKVVADAVAKQIGVIANNQTFGSDPALKHTKRLEVTFTVDGGAEHTEHVNENGAWAPSDFGGANHFAMTSTGDLIAFVATFSPQKIGDDLPDAAATFIAAERGWESFWESGGAIDLSASKDPRWTELERRIVLSQYLMKVNEAGDLPPQESGLVNNGWFGKFHMEMYWWHAAHYALWNRWPLLDRSLGVYQAMLPTARVRAKNQGYKGARWTKMTGPDFRNAAYITNALLAWQQPHPMFFAELDYRAHPNKQTLEKWRTVLNEAADFMASYAQWDEATKTFNLGPSMAVVSENTDDKVTTNPTFELGYWRFGLRIAQTWRERLGQPRDAGWDHVLNNLAPLPVEDGVYTTYQGIPQMWTKYNFEHPALTGVYGWLPGDGVDTKTMRATFERVLAKWKMDRVWGWDFPMMAMCAARLGMPEKAVDLLTGPTSHFAFDDAGLATGGPFPYFPSNGGLLYVIAMMAAGWDGETTGRSAPGFPDGWVVKSEGLSRAI